MIRKLLALVLVAFAAVSSAAVVRTVDSNSTPGLVFIKETIGSGETGNPVRLNQGQATVSVIPSGTCKLQYTTSLPDEVNRSVATWIDWSRGNVTSAVSDIPEGPATAVRHVSSSGNCTLEVVLRLRG